MGFSQKWRAQLIEEAPKVKINKVALTFLMELKDLGQTAVALKSCQETVINQRLADRRSWISDCDIHDIHMSGPPLSKVFQCFTDAVVQCLIP